MSARTKIAFSLTAVFLVTGCTAAPDDTPISIARENVAASKPADLNSADPNKDKEDSVSYSVQNEANVQDIVQSKSVIEEYGVEANLEQENVLENSSDVMPTLSKDLSLFEQSTATIDYYLANSQYVLPKDAIYFGPGLSDAIVQNNIESLDIISKVWSEFYAPLKYSAILWSEKDQSWAEDINNQYRIHPGWTFDPSACNGGNAGNEWNQISCIRTQDVEWGRAELVAHEYTHNVQWTVGGSRTGSVADYSRMWEIPSWLREGTATYYGWYVASIHKDNMSAHIENHVAGLSCMYKTGSAMRDDVDTKEEFINEMIDIEDGDGYWSKQYVYGGLATMILLAKYGGHDAFMDFYSGIRNGQSWEAAFEASFGISPMTFYSNSWEEFNKFNDLFVCWY